MPIKCAEQNMVQMLQMHQYFFLSPKCQFFPCDGIPVILSPLVLIVESVVYLTLCLFYINNNTICIHVLRMINNISILYYI